MGKADQGVEASSDRYAVIPRVLVFVFSEPPAPQAGIAPPSSSLEVLLLKGAPTKRIWANRYNGVGGHVEPYEDIYTAALRETQEETGLTVHDLQLQGVVNIDVGSSAAGQVTGILLFVFTAHSTARRTRPSQEGSLEWIPLHRIQDYDLVEDLPVLLERIQANGPGAVPFFARYSYDRDDRLCIAFAEMPSARPDAVS
jgi:8-oxo-dGTP diphosphatase